MKKILLLFLLCFGCQSPPSKTICLNMIVKNESDVIESSLNSVKHLIDYWVIIDTGSTDNTQEIIKKCLQDIPGELYQISSTDLTQNRNIALSLAKSKADYTLLIDASEILDTPNNFHWPSLDKDAYSLSIFPFNHPIPSERILLIRNRLDWKWEGALYEMLKSPQAKNFEFLKNVVNRCNPSVENRFTTTALLQRHIAKDPTNSLYPLHLGLEYLAEGKLQLARESFEKSLSLSQDPQTTYRATYHLGITHEKSGDIASALKSYMAAYAQSPQTGPLLRIATMYRERGHYLLGYLVAKHALDLQADHALLIEFANCALLLGKWSEGLDACNKLLADPTLPEEYKAPLHSNAQLALTNLSDKTSPTTLSE
ncbi:MAG TPA: glycosyltransferase [Chlamydiales bacterium]|nr:glycosyltransferase [Chlamydiales bacterium]